MAVPVLSIFLGYISRKSSVLSGMGEKYISELSKY